MSAVEVIHFQEANRSLFLTICVLSLAQVSAQDFPTLTFDFNRWKIS